MRAGRTLNDANLAKDGEIFRSIGGPAATYRNPDNTAQRLKSIGELPTKWYDPLMARPHRRNTQNNMDRATEFLTGKPGLNFCDECVREALGTTRANLTEKDLHTNAVSVGLCRAPGLCSSCGKQRIVTRTP
jgi:hypothetical protein